MYEKLSVYSLMTFRRAWRLFMIALAVAWNFESPAVAAITVSGDITPEYDGKADPWEIAGGLLVGNESAGAMGIDGGSTVSSLFGTIGRETGAAGTVTVSGSRISSL